jgi:hypothetical protein
VVPTGLTGVGRWTRGLVFRCVLGSEGCVLVPRSSGTPVATWAWLTWVVSQRRVLEAMFILLEFPSLSRRIFSDSHSLPPPLSGSPYRSFTRAAHGPLDADRPRRACTATYGSGPTWPGATSRAQRERAVRRQNHSV